MHAFPGRLLLMFSPTATVRFRLMRNALVDCFASALRDEDVLVMPEPVYFGGTVDRSVGSGDIVCDIERPGRKAFAFQTGVPAATPWSGWPSWRPHRGHGARDDHCRSSHMSSFGGSRCGEKR